MSVGFLHSQLTFGFFGSVGSPATLRGVCRKVVIFQVFEMLLDGLAGIIRLRASGFVCQTGMTFSIKELTFYQKNARLDYALVVISSQHITKQKNERTTILGTMEKFGGKTGPIPRI